MGCAILLVGGVLYVVLGVSIDVIIRRQVAKQARISRALRTDFPDLE